MNSLLSLEINYNFLYYGFFIIYTYCIVIMIIVKYLFSSTDKGVRRFKYNLNTNSFINCYIMSFLIILILILSIKGYSLNLCNSHLTLTNSIIKYNAFSTIFFYTIITLIVNQYNLFNQKKGDFIISKINISFCVFCLFYINNLFSFIFILEAMSISIMFFTSTSFVYLNSNLKHSNFDKNLNFFLNIPNFQVNSLITLFCISFFVSINLFILLYVFIYNLYSFDNTLMEMVYFYHSLNLSNLNMLKLNFIVILLLFSIMLKAGISPFFICKPSFFKGISWSAVLFYITYYYFFLFVFFINILSYYYSTYMLYNTIVVSLILIIGIFYIINNMYNVTYLKSFFAISSSLNSLMLLVIILIPNNPIQL